MNEWQCGVCRGRAVELLYELGGYSIVYCTACTHRFVAAAGKVPGLDGIYEQDFYCGNRRDGEAPQGYSDYLANADQRIAAFRERVATLGRHVAPGSVLDIGCAVGFFLVAARDAGWQVLGTETSRFAAAYGREHFQLDIVSADAAASEVPRAHFEAVTMWDVFEHVADPAALLADVRRWLRPRGVLALSTVNAGSLGARLAGARWRHLAPPHHLQYFSRQSLRELLQANGFTLLEERANGILLDSATMRPHLRHCASSVNNVARHWRLRNLVSRVDLLDEIDMVARLDG